MIRLGIVEGGWSLLMYSSLLRDKDFKEPDCEYDDYLILQTRSMSDDNIGQEFKDVNVDLANRLWDWKKIIFVQDIYYDDAEGYHFDQQVERIQKRVSLDVVDQLYVTHLQTVSGQWLLEAFPESELFLFEEGLGSYFHSHNIKKKYLERLKEFYSFVGHTAIIPPYLKHVPTTEISSNSVLLGLETANFLAERTSDDKIILVLGQAFYRYKDCLEWQTEYEMYKNVISELIQSEYIVMFKDHPRNQSPFIQMLQNEFGNNNLISCDVSSTMSIEFFVKNYNIIACLGVSSTSLFSFPKLFNIPSFTFGSSLLIDYFSRSFLGFTFKIADYYIPNYKLLLESKYSPNKIFELYEMFLRHNSVIFYDSDLLMERALFLSQRNKARKEIKKCKLDIVNLENELREKTFIKMLKDLFFINTRKD